MVEVHKPFNIHIGSSEVLTIKINGKNLYCFSDLGDAFGIQTRSRFIQLRMKILERAGGIRSYPIKGCNKNVRMISITDFKELISNAMPDEIKEGNFSQDQAKKILDSIDKYLSELIA